MDESRPMAAGLAAMISEDRLAVMVLRPEMKKTL
jgi:hypothetical protein